MLSFIFPWCYSLWWARVSSLSRLHAHTQTHHTQQHSSGRVVARHRDLYLTTHYTQNRQTSMSQAGFEPAIPASERTQTDALDRDTIVTLAYLYPNGMAHLKVLYITTERSGWKHLRSNLHYNRGWVLCFSNEKRTALRGIEVGTSGLIWYILEYSACTSQGDCFVACNKLLIFLLL
jgi:hypothetical protein